MAAYQTSKKSKKLETFAITPLLILSLKLRVWEKSFWSLLLLKINFIEFALEKVLCWASLFQGRRNSKIRQILSGSPKYHPQRAMISKVIGHRFQGAESQQVGTQHFAVFKGRNRKFLSFFLFSFLSLARPTFSRSFIVIVWLQLLCCLFFLFLSQQHLLSNIRLLMFFRKCFLGECGIVTKETMERIFLLKWWKESSAQGKAEKADGEKDVPSWKRCQGMAPTAVCVHQAYATDHHSGMDICPKAIISHFPSHDPVQNSAY